MGFGGDIGAIWRSGLDTEGKAVLTAVRYHGDDTGICEVSVERIETISGCSRSTVLRRLSDLVSNRWLEKVERGVYRVTPPGTHTVPVVGVSLKPVRHQKSVRGTPAKCQPDTCGHEPRCQGDTCKVSGGHLQSVSLTPSPTPPNKEFQTFSRLSPDVAASADAPSPARETPSIAPGLPEVERAFLAASGGGLQAKHPEMIALQSLTATHGAARVIEACDEAVLANSRGRVSVRFVEAILRGSSQRGTTGTAPQQRKGANRATAYRSPDGCAEPEREEW